MKKLLLLLMTLGLHTSYGQYCTTGLYSTACSVDDDIDDFSLGSFSHLGTACGGTAGYNDFTSMVITVTQTIPQALTVTSTYTFGSESLKLFIDYNNDQDFADPGEEVYLSPNTFGGPNALQDTLTFPSTSPSGTFRMRARLVFANTTFTACSNNTYGEVHDYTIVINPNAVGNCPVFSNFLVDSITANAAKVNWTPGTGNTSFFLEYGATGFTPGTGTKLTGTYPGSQPPVIISGLSQLTSYDLYFGEICNSGSDSVVLGAPASFTTTPLCPAPTGINVVGTTPSSATFGLNSAFPTFDVEWGPIGFSQGTGCFATLNATNNKVTISNSAAPSCITQLAPNTSYHFYVRNNCTSASNGTSPWLGPFTFTTACAPYVAPYSTTFDTDSVNEVPNCWSAILTGASSGGAVETYTFTSPYSPPQHVRMSNGGGTGANDTTMLISPQFSDLPNDGKRVQFFSKASTVGTTLIIGTVSSVTNGGSFSAIDTITLSNTYQIYSVNINSANGYNLTHEYVAFRHGNQATFRTIYIDNFTYEAIPACNPPLISTLGATGITANSASAYWGSGSDGSETHIELGTSGFAPGTGTYIISDSVAGSLDTFLLTGLNPQTSYDFYVRDSCGGLGFSPWIGPFIFTTKCLPAAMPYYESLDLWPVACWDSTQGTADWAKYVGGAGDNYAIADFWTNSSGVYHLTSPPITISQDAQLRFFWSHLYSTSYPDEELLVRVRLASGANWDTILSLKGPTDFNDPSAANTSPGSFVEEEILLNPALYTNNDIIIEFVGISDWGPNLYLNDIYVEPAPLCPKALALAATGITDSSVVLGWVGSSSHISYEVWFGPQGFYQGTQTAGALKIAAPFDSLAIDTLTDLTCYEFLVRAICGPGDTSDWEGPIVFCTPPTCPQPTALGVNPLQITVNSAGIYWTSGGASLFNVEYGPVGFSRGSGTMLNATNDTLSVSALMPGTRYEFYVRDSCGMGDVSLWSGPFSFTTAFTTNYSQNFTNNPPFAWSEADGRLKAATVFSSTTTSSWGPDNFANVGSNNAQGVNIWLGSQYEWIISPSIYLDPAINNLQVELDVAVTAYATNSQGYFGADDSLVLVISTDNGATWSSSNVLWYADASDTVDFTGEHIIVPMTGYSGYVRFGIYAGSAIDDVPDNDWFVDNFEVRTPRVCTPPTGLTLSDIKTDSALVSWTEGTPGFINAEVFYTLGNQPASMGTIVNSTNDSVYLTGLAPATQYCVYVVEECANGFSDTLGPVCFTTLCLPQSLPYSQDFDTWPPVCWTIDLGTTAWAGYSLGTDGWAEADFWGNQTGNMIMSSPIVAVNQDAQVRYTWSHLANTLSYPDDQLIVRVSIAGSGVWDTLVNRKTASSNFDDPTAGNTNPGVGVEDIWLLDPTTYTGQDIIVQFWGNTDWGPSLYINNFFVEKVASCPKPTALASSNVATTTATVSWTPGTASNTSFEVEYGQGLTFNALGTGTRISVTGTSQNLTALSAAANYCFFVREICAVGDTSNWEGPTCFTTLCAPLPLPYSEQFALTTLPNCYSTYNQSANTSANAFWKYAGTWPGYGATGINNAPGSAGGSWGVDGSTPNDSAVTLETPVFNVMGAGGPYLEFKKFQNNITSNGNMLFYVDVYDGATWNTQVLVDSGNSATWKTLSIDLSTFTITGPVQFRFVVNKYPGDLGTSFAFYSDVLVDDIRVFDSTGIGCSAPTALAASALGCDTAEVSWNSFSGAASTLLEYGPVGFAPGTGAGTVVAFVNSPYVITGLTAATGYDVYVADTCGASDTSSVAGPLNFTTASGPLPVASFTATPVGFSLTLDFDATASTGTDGTTTYTWDFGDGNNGSGDTTSHTYASGGSYAITLTVTNACGSDDTTITVADVSLADNPLGRSLSLYPNPASDKVSLSFSTLGRGEVSVKVMDMTGKKVMHLSEANHNSHYSGTLDVSSLADGVYMLWVSDGENQAVRRLIKE